LSGKNSGIILRSSIGGQIFIDSKEHIIMALYKNREGKSQTSVVFETDVKVKNDKSRIVQIV
jgi:hypothetical protein